MPGAAITDRVLRFADVIGHSSRVQHYRAAGARMKALGKLQGIADEGGYWPAFDANEEALDEFVRAIESAGLRGGRDVAISLDIAASEFGRQGSYTLALEGRTPIQLA